MTEDGTKFGALLDETIRLVRAHPVPLLGPMVLLGALTNLGNGRPRYRYSAAPLTPDQALKLLPFFALLGVVAIVVVVLLAMLYALVVLVTTRAALDAIATDRDPDLQASYRGVKGGYWGALGTFVLLVLIVIVGFILLVVPGLIAISGLFALAAVVVAEGKHGGAALSRAWELAKGRKWHIFGVLIVAGLVSAVASLVFGWIPLIGDVIAGAISGALSAGTLVAGAVFYVRRTRGAAPVAPPAGPAPAW